MALTKRDRHAIRFLLVLICITIALRAWGIVRPAKEWGISDLGNPFAMDNTYLGSRFYQEAATHQETRYGNKDALPSRYPSGCSTKRQKPTENRQKDTSEFPYRSRSQQGRYLRLAGIERHRFGIFQTNHCLPGKTRWFCTSGATARSLGNRFRAIPAYCPLCLCQRPETAEAQSEPSRPLHAQKASLLRLLPS